MKENFLFTRLARLSRPPDFATAATPRIGRHTALKINPAMAIQTEVPALKPRNGGKIRFPAPKNIENKVMPTNKQSRLESLFKKITPFKLYISASLK